MEYVENHRNEWWLLTRRPCDQFPCGDSHSLQSWHVLPASVWISSGGVQLSTTIKNMYSRVKIQLLPSTKCADKDLDRVLTLLTRGCVKCREQFFLSITVNMWQSKASSSELYQLFVHKWIEMKGNPALVSPETQSLVYYLLLKLLGDLCKCIRWRLPFYNICYDGGRKENVNHIKKLIEPQGH